MARIVWDKLGAKQYAIGLDRGVLYLPSSTGTTYPTGVAWNGLVDLNEQSKNVTVKPYYNDGVKYFEQRTTGEFAASISAFTYPEEFERFEGYAHVAKGMYLDEQPVVERFGLSYRTGLGNDLLNEEFGYRLHILYNLVAVPDSRQYSAFEKLSPVDFGWQISGVPEDFPGYRPTTHVVFDTRETPKSLIGYIENILYGSSGRSPKLPTPTELVELVENWVFDLEKHSDGSWTLTASHDVIEMTDEDSFEITTGNATYIGDDTYRLEDD
jgi:hypothetical protein